MVGILPEIVDLAADETADRDAILGLGDVERLGIVTLVAGIGLDNLMAPSPFAKPEALSAS